MNLKIKEILSILVFIPIVLSIRLSVLVPTLITDNAKSAFFKVENLKTASVIDCDDPGNVRESICF